MFDAEHLVVVTNRLLCRDDYLQRIRSISALHPAALILREKDLPVEEYAALAKQVMSICEQEKIPCFLHSHAALAAELGCRCIHLSIPALREQVNLPDTFEEISISCHSLTDVEEAVAAGATRVVLGNIFETDCKKGLAGKGLDFLKEVCAAATVPVYAIGGISPENLPEVLASGAAGGCMMSGFMKMEL